MRVGTRSDQAKRRSRKSLRPKEFFSTAARSRRGEPSQGPLQSSEAPHAARRPGFFGEEAPDGPNGSIETIPPPPRARQAEHPHPPRPKNPEGNSFFWIFFLPFLTFPFYREKLLAGYFSIYLGKRRKSGTETEQERNESERKEERRRNEGGKEKDAEGSPLPRPARFPEEKGAFRPPPDAGGRLPAATICRHAPAAKKTPSPQGDREKNTIGHSPLPSPRRGYPSPPFHARL